MPDNCKPFYLYVLVIMAEWHKRTDKWLIGYCQEHNFYLTVYMKLELRHNILRNSIPKNNSLISLASDKNSEQNF